jgi:hypothetical protein
MMIASTRVHGDLHWAGAPSARPSGPRHLFDHRVAAMGLARGRHDQQSPRPDRRYGVGRSEEGGDSVTNDSTHLPHMTRLIGMVELRVSCHRSES